METSNEITGKFSDESISFCNGVELGLLMCKFRTREIIEKETISSRLLGEALRFAILNKYRFDEITIWNDDYFVVSFYPLI